MARRGPRIERLSAHDSAFLDQATSGAPMNVGGLITFERRPATLELSRLQGLIADRLALVPRFRQRAERDGRDAIWVDDAGFRLDEHIDELPFAADDSTLLSRVAALHGEALDPDGPLWRVSLLRQGNVGGAALLFRASHAVIDGLGAMQVMRSLFDPTPGERSAATATSLPASPPDEPDGGAVGSHDAFDPGRDLKSILRPRGENLDPARYDEALVLLDGWISILALGRHGMPRFPCSGDVRMRIATADVPSAPMRRIRVGQKVRFDELALTLVGGGLARLFAGRGGVEADARIRTFVPIGGALPGRRADLGNRSAFLVIALPIGAMAVGDRLSLVAAEVRDALAAGQHRATAIGLRALETAPPGSTSAISSLASSGQFVDLVVSCVPGSRRVPRLDGIPHAATFPLLPITPKMRVAVGMADIGGRLGIAATADRAALPELDFFVDGIVRSAAELAARARRT